jgi:hypothetical protein
MITLNQALEQIGRDAVDGGDLYYLPPRFTPTQADVLLSGEPVPLPFATNTPPEPNAPQGPQNPASGTQTPNSAPKPPESNPGASGGKSAVERVGPFPYAPDPLPPAVFDMAERRKLSRAWDSVFDGTEFVGMLDAEAVNGNGTH